MSLALIEPPTLPNPHNLDAEQALLGAIMFDNAVYGRVSGELTAEHFYEPYHGLLYRLIGEKIAEGRLAEPTILMGRLATDPQFAENGGMHYLADLVDKAPPSGTAEQFAQPIIEAATRRRMIEIGAALQTMARDPGEQPFATLTAAGQRLDEIVAGAAPDGTHLVDARSSMETTIQRLIEARTSGKVRGAMTGLRCFDRRMGGLKPGKLIVVAGRPSMGKSGLCRAAAVGCARRNPDKDVLYFTVEMEREEIDLRTMSQISFEMGQGFKYQDIEDDFERVGIQAIEDIAPGVLSRVPSNLIMDDTPRLSVTYIRRRLLSHMRKRPVAAVFIDYLQIMQRPDARGRNEASVVGEITTELKALTREGKCAIVLLSQLSRQCETRENKRPMLSDLRESGSIEQDANAVLLCYRDVYYLARSGPEKGQSEFEHEMRMAEVESRMEVICAKQRAGPIGTDLQRYEAAYDFIEDMDQ